MIRIAIAKWDWIFPRNNRAIARIIGIAMKLPRNVLWFVVLLYASLVLDALTVAFQDRTAKPVRVLALLDACLILLLFFFVWLAAQRRKNWPRWVLVAALV